MNRKMLAVLATLCATAAVMATPTINGAVINQFVFHDVQNSNFTSTNLYPTSIVLQDQNLATGGANRHNFRLSSDNGISEAVFLNDDAFMFSADVNVSGNSEGGLQVSPWWSKEVDGVFMLNAMSGEIACFGGRLPFYSFTGNFGLHYTPGTTVNQTIIYNPHSLTQADPATLTYQLVMGGQTYSSGALAFDQGNPAEDPPYGLWGMLNDARVGGYLQVIGNATAATEGRAEYSNMTFAVPEPASLLALAVLGLAIRRGR